MPSLRAAGHPSVPFYFILFVSRASSYLSTRPLRLQLYFTSTFWLEFSWLHLSIEKKTRQNKIEYVNTGTFDRVDFCSSNK